MKWVSLGCKADKGGVEMQLLDVVFSHSTALTAAQDLSRVICE